MVPPPPGEHVVDILQLFYVLTGRNIEKSWWHSSLTLLSMLGEMRLLCKATKVYVTLPPFVFPYTDNTVDKCSLSSYDLRNSVGEKLESLSHLLQLQSKGACTF